MTIAITQWRCPVCGTVQEMQTPIEAPHPKVEPPEGWRAVRVPVSFVLDPLYVESRKLTVCPGCAQEVEKFVKRLVDAINEVLTGFRSLPHRRVSKAYHELYVAWRKEKSAP